MSQRVYYGSSEPTGWVQHPDNENQIYVDIDTTHCKFKGVPRYVCSLEGTSHHWSTTGGSAPYTTPTGFRINVRNAVVMCPGGKCEYDPLKIERARKYCWRINWIAFDDED